MKVTHSALNDRIQVLGDGSDLRNNRIGAAAAASAAAIGQSRGNLAARDALTAGGLIGDGVTRGNAPQRPAGLRTLQIPFSAHRPVTIQLEIQVVFDRQSQRVLHRQIQLAAANQAVDSI